MSQHPRKRSISFGEYLIGLLILAILGTLAEAFYPSQVNNILQTVAPSCSVRIASATITVRAWSSNSDCNALLSGSNNFTGWDWTKFGVTSTSEVDGDIQCELTFSGRDVIVRDAPMSNTGNEICQLLQRTDPGP